MARLARVVVPNCPHYITQRGNRRQHRISPGGEGGCGAGDPCAGAAERKGLWLS